MSLWFSEFRREIALMLWAKNPFMLNVLAVSSAPSMLVMELCSEGDLRTVLNKLVSLPSLLHIVVLFIPHEVTLHHIRMLNHSRTSITGKLIANNNGPLSRKTALKVLHDLGRGLAYMHSLSPPIVHRYVCICVHLCVFLSHVCVLCGYSFHY